MNEEDILQGEQTKEMLAQDEDELSALREEVLQLKNELRARDELDAARSRMDTELSSFAEYFPQVDPRQIPENVWNEVKRGTSLSASYALYLRRAELEKQKIDDFNSKNRRMSAGSLLQGEGERYFSPSEVKKMSPAQVKQNYDDIINSMRHWN